MHLEPHLAAAGISIGNKIIVLLATVEGDIHDIGKNIVALLLRNHGFDVVDLGKDVSTRAVIEAIKKYDPALVGLSALMTTTMVNMKDVVEAARAEGLRCRFMVGGAAVSHAYAQSIDASYARDGVEAVRVARELAQE
jgi:5-methyltetrahydrofolate--homocysteine methyltransferase